MAVNKERLDIALVRRGLAPSRERARALIMAGQVLVANHIADKPARSNRGYRGCYTGAIK